LATSWVDSEDLDNDVSSWCDLISSCLLIDPQDNEVWSTGGMEDVNK